MSRACGNVVMMGAGSRHLEKTDGFATVPCHYARPHFYPDSFHRSGWEPAGKSRRNRLFLHEELR